MPDSLSPGQQLGVAVPCPCVQMVRDAVDGVEKLDGALKRRLPWAEVQPVVQQLQESLNAVANAVDAMQEMT